MPERPTPEEFNRPTENPETQELSPEVLEMVMEKVKDINQKGTAFLALMSGGTYERRKNPRYDFDNDEIKQQRIYSALTNGVLGVTKYGTRENTSSPQEVRQEYLSMLTARKEKPVDSHINFNIIGRSTTYKFNQFLESVKENHYMGRSEDIVGVVFDLSKYTETYPPFDEENLLGVGVTKGIATVGNADLIPFGTFASEEPDLTTTLLKRLRELGIMDLETARSMLKPGSDFLKHDPKAKSQGYKWRKKVNEDGLLGPDDEYGFVLNGRIPPRNFQALIVQVFKYTFNKETSEYEELPDYRERLLVRTKKVASKMLAVDEPRPELLVPIYDTEGNLLWPKQMSYQEVKEFVAQSAKAEIKD